MPFELFFSSARCLNKLGFPADAKHSAQRLLKPAPFGSHVISSGKPCLTLREVWFPVVFSTGSWSLSVIALIPACNYVPIFIVFKLMFVAGHCQALSSILFTSNFIHPSCGILLTLEVSFMSVTLQPVSLVHSLSRPEVFIIAYL